MSKKELSTTFQQIKSGLSLALSIVSILTILISIVWWASTVQSDIKHIVQTLDEIKPVLAKVNENEKELALINQILGIK